MNRRADDPRVSGYNFSLGKPQASNDAQTAASSKPSQMKDALDKALEDHRLNVDVTDTFTEPRMKWLYKHPTKKINKQRLDSQQVSPILKNQIQMT